MTDTRYWMKGALATALTAALALPALAQGPGAGPKGGPGGGRPAMMMTWFDADDDGRITVEEFTTGHAQRFAVWDADGDGRVTLVELKENWQGRNPARTERLFVRLDTNSDGVVTLEEFNGRGDAMFKRLDANNDGALTEDELPMAGPGGMWGPGGMGGGPGFPPPGPGPR